MSDKLLSSQEIFNRCFINNSLIINPTDYFSTQNFLNAIFDSSNNALRISVNGGEGITYWQAPVATIGDLPLTGGTGETRIVRDAGDGVPGIYTFDGVSWVVSGGGNSNDLGWFATPLALTTAHPTADDGNFAIVGTTDTVWVWDSDTTSWLDTGLNGLVTSVFGRTGPVTAQANDYTWNQINKATSSLADITTRSAGDLSSGNLNIARMPVGGIWGLTSPLSMTAPTYTKALTFDAVYYYDGAVFTDNTEDAKYRDSNITLFESTTDMTYVGLVDTPPQAIGLGLYDYTETGATLVLEYWNGSAWTPAVFVDDTNGLNKDGALLVTLQGDEAKTIVNGLNSYWLRLSSSTQADATPIASVIAPYDSIASFSVNGDTAPNYSMSVTAGGTTVWRSPSSIDPDASLRIGYDSRWEEHFIRFTATNYEVELNKDHLSITDNSSDMYRGQYYARQWGIYNDTRVIQIVADTFMGQLDVTRNVTGSPNYNLLSRIDVADGVNAHLSLRKNDLGIGTPDYHWFSATQDSLEFIKRISGVLSTIFRIDASSGTGSITMLGHATALASISTGLADNDKLVTKGYVDDKTWDASDITTGNIDIARMPTGGSWSLSSPLTIASSGLGTVGSPNLILGSNGSGINPTIGFYQTLSSNTNILGLSIGGSKIWESRYNSIGIPTSMFSLAAGAFINEFSSDGTMAGNSTYAVPTESAVVTYVGANTFWNRTGTILSPKTAGDNVELTTATQVKELLTLKNTNTSAESITTIAWHDEDGLAFDMYYHKIDTNVGNFEIYDNRAGFEAFRIYMGSGNAFVRGGFIVNNGAVDSDFIIRKLTSGDAYQYDAGNDAHLWGGTTYTIAAETYKFYKAGGNNNFYIETNSTNNARAIVKNGDGNWAMGVGSGGNWTLSRIGTFGNAIQVDNAVAGNNLILNLASGNTIFNGAYLDWDFTIRKLTSGSALVYDAGLDRITLGSVLGLANGTVSLPSLIFDGETTTGLYRKAANSLSIATQATERFNIDASGIVSINSLSAPSDGTIPVASTTGALSLSTALITSSPTGGSMLNLAEYASDPSSGLLAGDIWIVANGSGSKLLKYYDGSVKYSVELTQE